MIDKAFDRIARVIELTLALAFILAVLLNFANVVGRYLLGISLLGSDEVQVFIMVAMTFLGAAVVTRRNLHLRMDVLVRFLPAPAQRLLRIAEQLLLVVARRLRADAVLPLRPAHAVDRTHQRHGRRADVDPARHGGARLRTDPDRRLWRLLRMARRRPAPGRRPEAEAMTFALAVVPIVLLLLGFPIFMVLLTGGDGGARVLHECAARGAASEPVRLGQRIRRCSRCRSSSMPAS